MINKIFRLVKLLLFGFMLAVCIVMGVAVVIPKRKEESGIEVRIAEDKEKSETTATIKGIYRE